jgi:hypothetical protein
VCGPADERHSGCSRRQKVLLGFDRSRREYRRVMEMISTDGGGTAGC